MAVTMGALTTLGCGKPGWRQELQARKSGPEAPTGGLINKVMAKLRLDKGLKDVKVSELNGSIQLDGMVTDVPAKDRAETIVMEVQKEMKSQGSVLNNIQIKE